MKAILIAFLLLATVIFLPSLTLARELKATEVFNNGDPQKPAIKCDPNKSYRSCLPPKAAPKATCNPYSRNC
ncbi:uncharacterized protein LOC113851544 [Abrus precatorius]|uniref:Uncharacterized protein LOC113851544 n=1 Tax=Abrus precatorius TaxID=3816 RepID=A0A8B8K2I7_ABRPR|nr:uncharacterized protein LOC113851544 [Abrus precatorius]